MKNQKALWSLAYRNLFRNSKRTLATALALIFGYVGLVLLSAYIYRTSMGLQSAAVYLNQKGHIAVFKNDSLDKFTAQPRKYVLKPEDLTKIQTVLDQKKDLIEFTTPFLSGTGLLLNGQQSAAVLITGFDPPIYRKLIEHPEMKKWAEDWVLGSSAENLRALEANPKAVSITALLAEAVGLKGKINEIPSELRELQLITKSYTNDLGAVDAFIGAEHTTGMKLSEETSLIAPLPLLQELFGTDGVEYLAIYLHKASATNEVAQFLKKNLDEQYDIYTFDDETWSPIFAGTMNFLYVIAIFFIVLILGAVALTLVNTTTLNILERTKEIGTLRAIGYTSENIRALFRRETILLCTVCLIFGSFVALGFAETVNAMKIYFHPPATQGEIQFKLIINFTQSLVMAFLVFAITLIATEVVTKQKSQKKIVNLLHEEGA